MTRIYGALGFLPPNMDFTTSAGFQSGVPEELLHILGSDCLKKAQKWTLTQTKRRYFLNIVVSRKQPFIFPAKTEKPSNPDCKAKDAGTGLIPPGTYPESGLSKDSSDHGDRDAGGFSQPVVNRTSIHPDPCSSGTSCH